MKPFDHMLTWAFILAIVAVVAASKQTEIAIYSIANLVSSLIGVIVSPQTGR